MKTVLGWLAWNGLFIAMLAVFTMIAYVFMGGAAMIANRMPTEIRYFVFLIPSLAALAVTLWLGCYFHEWFGRK